MPTTLYTTYVPTRILRPCDGPEGGFEMLFGLFEEKISRSVQTNSMVPNMVIRVVEFSNEGYNIKHIFATNFKQVKI